MSEERRETFHYDGSGDQTIHFDSDGTADSAQITITDSEGSVVYSGAMGALADGEGTWTWNGQSTDGNTSEPAGDYTFSISATTDAGATVDVTPLVVGTNTDEGTLFTGGLLSPTVIDANSSFSGSTPVRAYAMDSHHRGVRLVFLQGSGQYWGIQETNFTRAPILADRSFRRVLGGRIYDLYYTGSHLHMVVLRWGGASYWVVNTLLDNISNETLFAIAKGLQPLKRSPEVFTWDPI